MWRYRIGILGGLGPYAHIEFERCLLAALGCPANDQAYPEWIVVSIPHTPDRTEALLGRGPSPIPAILQGLERLASGADFAAITCITAHAFLDEIRARARVPILDMVDLTLAAAQERASGARIGVLATTGALRSGIFSRPRTCRPSGLEVLSLLDLPGGLELQEDLVMRPIYGPLYGGLRRPGGIKSGGDRDPESGIPHRATLTAAVRALADAGASCVITGCTEIPLALGRDPVHGTLLLDPLEVAAHAAIRIARGQLSLP
ncbi:MAG: aspartate racemase [Acidobacteriota bacterium]|jgi:aspartate racemase|nr:aspartate racemase [Acidobacteriota bacterium]